jgi:hypothetical protein
MSPPVLLLRSNLGKLLLATSRRTPGDELADVYLFNPLRPVPSLVDHDPQDEVPSERQSEES